MRPEDVSFRDLGIDVPPGEGDVKVHCPRCHPGRRNRHDKSLSVNRTTGVFRCHHPDCGWASGLGKEGRAMGLVDGPSPGWRPAPTRPNPAPAQDEPPMPTWEPPAADVVLRRAPQLGPGAVAWFAGRGIDEEIVRRYGITSGLSDNGPVIYFPYLCRGETVNVKRRWLDAKDFRQAKGAARYLYGLDDLAARDPWQPVVLVEGELDKLALAQVGIDSAASLPDGAIQPTDRKRDGKLAALAEPTAAAILAAAERFIIATDADAPGESTAKELARLLGEERCFRVRWPDGCNDANDVLVKHGPGRLVEVMETPARWPMDGVKGAGEYGADVSEMHANGIAPGVSTGFANMDREPATGNVLYRPKPGHLTILTGIPTHGKSSWLDHLIVNLADLHGWRFGVFSPEHQPVARHVAVLVGIANDRPFFAADERRVSQEGMRRGMEWLDEHFFFLDPDDVSIDSVLNRAYRLVVRAGIKGLVIDPWSELETVREKGDPEPIHVGKVIAKIRRFARANGVHVWLVAHPTKMTRKDDGSYPVPTLYDVAGAAMFNNMADNGIAVWRDPADTTRPTEVHVLKSKFRETGQPGIAYFNFDPAKGRYSPDGSPRRVDGSDPVAALARLGEMARSA